MDLPSVSAKIVRDEIDRLRGNVNWMNDETLLAVYSLLPKNVIGS